jgi:hypothetical protein
LLQSGLSLFQASLDFWRIESGNQFSCFYFLAQNYWHVVDAAAYLGLDGRAQLGSESAHDVFHADQGFGFDSLGPDLNRRQLRLHGRVALVRFVAAGKEHHPRWQSEQVRPPRTTCGCNPIEARKFGDLFHLF